MVSGVSFTSSVVDSGSSSSFVVATSLLVAGPDLVTLGCSSFLVGDLYANISLR